MLPRQPGAPGTGGTKPAGGLPRNAQHASHRSGAFIAQLQARAALLQLQRPPALLRRLEAMAIWRTRHMRIHMSICKCASAIVNVRESNIVAVASACWRAAYVHVKACTRRRARARPSGYYRSEAGRRPGLGSYRTYRSSRACTTHMVICICMVQLSRQLEWPAIALAMARGCVHACMRVQPCVSCLWSMHPSGNKAPGVAGC